MQPRNVVSPGVVQYATVCAFPQIMTLLGVGERLKDTEYYYLIVVKGKDDENDSKMGTYQTFAALGTSVWFRG